MDELWGSLHYVHRFYEFCLFFSIEAYHTAFFESPGLTLIYSSVKVLGDALFHQKNAESIHNSRNSSPHLLYLHFFYVVSFFSLYTDIYMDRQVQLHDLEDSDRYAGSFNTQAGLVIYLLKDIPETG
jgi:hypothetical protein